jgi:hypothetical protein
MKKRVEIKWLDAPRDGNYPAVYSYLNLLYNGNECEQMIEKLKQADLSSFKAKDIFRASQLSLLGISNSHVKKDIKRIKKAEPLSPILLVRDTSHLRLIIADGYHRMCAVYTFDEDALIPCKII